MKVLQKAKPPIEFWIILGKWKLTPPKDWLCSIQTVDWKIFISSIRRVTFSGRSARLTIGIHPWKLKMNRSKIEGFNCSTPFLKDSDGVILIPFHVFFQPFPPACSWQVDARFNRCLCQSTLVGSGGDDAFGLELGALSTRTGHLEKNIWNNPKENWEDGQHKHTSKGWLKPPRCSQHFGGRTVEFSSCNFRFGVAKNAERCCESIESKARARVGKKGGGCFRS